MRVEEAFCRGIGVMYRGVGESAIEVSDQIITDRIIMIIIGQSRSPMM